MAKKEKKAAPKKKKSKSYKVRLTRLASNNANLRTPTVHGTTSDLPVMGEPFVLISESLTTPGDGFRLVTTSPVTLVDEGNEWFDPILFNTLNSSYSLQILPDEEEE